MRSRPNIKFNPITFPKLRHLVIMMCDVKDRQIKIFDKSHTLEIFEFQGFCPLLVPFLKTRKIIRKLFLEECTFLIDDLRAILKHIAGNLIEISLKHVTIQEKSSIIPITLPKLKSVRLECGTLVRIGNKIDGPFPLFSLFNCFTAARSLETLIFNGHVEMRENAELPQSLKELFSRSTKLRKLHIREHLASLFKDSIVTDVTTFKLEELSLEIASISELEHNTEVFYTQIFNFIMKQQLNLRILSLKNIVLNNDIISCILGMKNLNSASFTSCPHVLLPQKFHSNNSIKMLSFEKYENSSTIIWILLKCPNVQKISFTDLDVSLGISNAFKHLKKLDTLKFKACSIYPANYRTVTTIEFHSSHDNIVNIDDVTNVLRENRQLSVLLLPGKTVEHKKFKDVAKDLRLDELIVDDSHLMTPPDEHRSYDLIVKIGYYLLVFLVIVLVCLMAYLLFIYYGQKEVYESFIVKVKKVFLADVN
ncbi:uncharacterized protein [Chironomus tepperi]